MADSSNGFVLVALDLDVEDKVPIQYMRFDWNKAK